MKPEQKKGSSILDGHQQIAREIGEAATRIVDAIRDAFGPQKVEIRLQDPERAAALALKDTLDRVRVRTFETREEQLKREIRDRVLELCGFVDGGEVTADGSMSNDLAHERADAVMDMLNQVRGHDFPQAVTPPAEGAPLYQLLNALRPLVYRVVNATAEGDAALTDNVDVIMAFVNLAREHPDPKRLLPRGDRIGGWLVPGTEVLIHLGGQDLPAVVEPARDMVTVRLAGSGVVTEFPRSVITKEGEPWTPPKLTNS